MQLHVGDILTRDELSTVVGAGGDSCFLHKDGVVVAMAMDPGKNPEAPDVVLVGKGPHKERYAQQFLGAKSPVPSFVKLGVNQWQYVGLYRAIGLDQSSELIALHSKKSGRDDIWGVLFLESD